MSKVHRKFISSYLHVVKSSGQKKNGPLVVVFAILKIPKDHLALRLSRSYPKNIRAGYELRTENNGGGVFSAPTNCGK